MASLLPLTYDLITKVNTTIQVVMAVVAKLHEVQGGTFTCPTIQKVFLEPPQGNMLQQTSMNEYGCDQLYLTRHDHISSNSYTDNPPQRLAVILYTTNTMHHGTYAAVTIIQLYNPVFERSSDSYARLTMLSVKLWLPIANILNTKNKERYTKIQCKQTTQTIQSLVIYVKITSYLSRALR